MKQKSDVKILVDYLTFTVGYEEIVLDSVDEDDQDETSRGVLRRVQEVFSLQDADFRDFGHGLNGYVNGWSCQDQVFVCWGGNGGTLMVQFSGKGCRLYESLQQGKDFDWLLFIRKIEGYRVHNFTRIDIACDTFAYLDMEKILRYTDEERFVSPFEDHEVRKGNKIRQATFGAESSRVYLRIYDKTLERQRELGKDADVPQDWIRLEFQFRKEGAESFIAAWKSTGNISTAYFGLMANQLRYVKKRESNASRSETVIWWRNFLSNADKIPLAYKGGLEYNLDSLKRYVFGQAGSSLRTWCELTDWDMDKLREIIENKRLNPRQENLLRNVKGAT